MTSISDEFILLGFGAFAFVLLYTLIKRTYHAIRQRISALSFSALFQRISTPLATSWRQRHAHHPSQGTPVLNEVAADIPAGPHATRASP